MSEALINDWLDDEMDEACMSGLDEWLREDPIHLECFFDAVKFQEELHVHFGRLPATIALPSRDQNMIRLAISLATIAAIILVAFFITPRESNPQPTIDPLVWVLDGNPRVEIERIEPGPNPFPIPQEQWPVVTKITTSTEPGSLTWNNDCEVEAASSTRFTLRSSPDHDAPDHDAPDAAPGGHESAPPRSIRLEAGSLTIHLTESSAPVDILVGESQIRCTTPVKFTLQITEKTPNRTNALLSVTRGELELETGDSIQSVIAGQRNTIHWRD